MKKTVFAPVPRGSHPNELMAAWFSRGMAIKYLLYTLWATVSLWEGPPSLIESQGEFWQGVFSVMTLTFCLLAATGATFFPRTGRLELFAGAAVVGLIAMYAVMAAMSGASLRGVILISSLLVMPVIRTVWIYRTMIQTAAARS